MSEPLLEFRSGTKIYGGSPRRRGVVGLDDVSLVVEGDPPAITVIAGESGSGKTTLANAILGLISLSSGQVLYKGRAVSSLRAGDWFEYRRQVQAIFQDPYEAFNPFFHVQHVFNQIIRKFGLAHSSRDAREMVEDALQSVGLDGSEVLKKHPHQLSGGQRQRIMIARLLLLRPRLVVADEPVSMVDASLRMTILDMLAGMRDKHGVSFLYITHDLSTAYRISDEIYILYSGTIAEVGRTKDVIDSPKHPYVQLLIESIPVPARSAEWRKKIVLELDEGLGGGRGKGCLYYPRCPYRMDRCREDCPPLHAVSGNGHLAACHLYEPAEGSLLSDPGQQAAARPTYPAP